MSSENNAVISKIVIEYHLRKKMKSEGQRMVPCWEPLVTKQVDDR